MNTLSKLQSEAVNKIYKQFPYIKADIGDKLYKEFETLIADQIQKAYEAGIKEVLRNVEYNA